MRLTITHETIYKFAKQAKHSIQYLRLTPTGCASQRVLSWAVSTQGSITPWIDGFGNSAHVSTIDEPIVKLKCSSKALLRLLIRLVFSPVATGFPQSCSCVTRHLRL